MNGQWNISVKSAVLYGVLVLVLIFGALMLWPEGEEGWTDEFSEGESDAPECNIVVVPIRGTLFSYTSPALVEEYGDVVGSDDVVFALQELDMDPATKAVIVAIDSGGGDGTAGEEIARALSLMEKPNVAVVRTIAASAAYWAAVGADAIYASRISDVGSIGITMSYLDDAEKSRLEGYEYVELASGKYKDTLAIGKPLNADERALLLADIKKAHEVFVDDVAQYRTMPREKVAALADGRTFVGEDALAHGLIDRLGDTQHAADDLAAIINEEPVVCWY